MSSPVELARSERVVGELVSPADELVAMFVLSLGEGNEQTVRTYRGACERFVGWLVDRVGSTAGPGDLSIGQIAAYEAELRAAGLSDATIRKDRSALNRMVRFLAEHELIDRQQARLALARKLPRQPRGERERPKCLDDVAYRRLLTEAEAAITHHQLQGWRDLAIVRVLGDAGLRCEELVSLQRRDFKAKRKGARLRALQVRRGKGNRRRTVELTPAATAAVLKWDERRREIGPPTAEPELAPSEWPLFVTLGQRRRDGSYARLGARPGVGMVEDVIKRLGARAEVDADLRHPHVLRHTFATRYYRRTRDLAGLQRLLGHEDPKTTMIYVDDDPGERERLILLAADEPTTLDLDREVA